MVANRKFQVPINLVNLSSDPASADEGDIYYNTTSDVIRVYANGSWADVAAGGGGGGGAINDLTDVTISSVSDNEILQYDSGTSQWINQTISEAGLVAGVGTNKITYATTAPSSPSTGDIWIDSDATVSGAALDDLSDVVITTPATNSFLQYNGTSWIDSGQTLSLGGNFTTSGAFAVTLTSTATTSLTLPTSGTLATTSDLSSYLTTSSASSTYAPLASPTLTGILTIRSATTNGIELGRVDGTGSTPYLYFHSSGNNIDYDSRILGTGGSASVGTGSIQITAADVLLSGTLSFEGSSADANETTLTVTNPTADRTITFPDADGTVVLTSGATFTGSVALNGGFSVDSTAFSVADTTGNTSIAGTLSVTGAITGTPATPGNTTSADAIGYIGIPQVLNPSSPYTISASDAGKHIYMTTSGRTITIPANGSVPLEIGTTIVIINAASVTTTIDINTDTLLLAGTGSTGNRTLAQHGMATCVKITDTSWIISGNGLT